MSTTEAIAQIIINASADLLAGKITEDQHEDLTAALWARAEELRIATGVEQIIAGEALKEMAALGAV